MYGGSSNAGNVWIGNPNNITSPMAPYLHVMEEIHVLLVDNDPKALFETGKMLQMHSYKVTHVDLASSAISVLSNQHAEFDVVMASTNSPDRQGFKLLQLAVALSIPVVLLSVDDDAFFTSKAIQDGAFLNIPKPAPMVMVRFLWQHVMREKTQKILRDQRDQINAAGNNDFNVELTNHMNESFELREPFGIGGMNNVPLAMDNNNNNMGKQVDDGTNAEGYHGAMNQSVKRKSCIEWTDELHAKFVHAVRTLGDGRCFPKEILQLMNVPGLTRMQVASHLQKCRNEACRLSEEERNNQLASTQSKSDSNSVSPP